MVGVCAAVTLGCAGVAYAFVTGTPSSKTATATVATPVGINANLQAAVATSGTLVPGGSTAGTDALDVAVTVKNDNKAAVSVGVPTVAVTGLPTGCVAADFTVVAPTVPVGTIAAGATSAAVHATVKMNDTVADQTGCLGQTPTLTVSF